MWPISRPRSARDENFDGMGARGLHVAGFHQVAVHSVLHNFRQAADVGGDDRNLAGHGFQRG